MVHMVSEWELPLSKYKDYLTYMVMIFEFGTLFDWKSVLDFDARYRIAQYDMKYRRGKASSHLETFCLKARKPPAENGGGGKSKKRKESTICTQFQSKGKCSYGDNCRYQHVPPPLE